MATKQQSLTPLIDIQSAEFAKQYESGVWWSMYGEEQGKGPVAASCLVTILKDYAHHDYFGTNDPSHLHHLGFFLGMYHGGILSPQTGQLRSDVMTLAHLDHREARRGYRAGREFYFVDADPMNRGILSIPSSNGSARVLAKCSPGTMRMLPGSLRWDVCLENSVDSSSP